jgi:DNA repair protein RecO (recombination protein O)
MREERSPAIVLRTRAHAESDKIVTCLSRDWGKISAIAKGAKRSRRRFVNVLEPFSHIQLRFRPSRSEDLMFLLGAELIQAFRRPSVDLERFALASYIVELADVMTAGREAGQDMYQLVLSGLSTLEAQPRLSPLFAPLFALQILHHVGYAPDFTTCQQCGASLTERAQDGAGLALSSQLGGLLCPRCHGHGGTILRLSPETVAVLWAYHDPQVAPPVEISLRTRHEVPALVTRLLSPHLTRPLKSLAFLEQVGVQGMQPEPDPT